MNRELDQTCSHAQLAAVGWRVEHRGALSTCYTVAIAILGHGSFRRCRSATHPLHRRVEMPRSGICLADRCHGTEVWLLDLAGHKGVFGQPIMPPGSPRSWRRQQPSQPPTQHRDQQFEVEQMRPSATLTAQLIRGEDSQIQVEIYSRTRGGYAT